MKLPRHATFYLMFIGVLSLFQLALGANLLVLIAIDLVSLCAVYPMTRKNFGPNDLLFLSFCCYYGTFSLILKCVVLQAVQTNLEVPLITSAYLDTGFAMIFLSYLFVERVLTRHYRGTNLRRWTWLERAYASERFLIRFTLPISVISIAFTVVIALFSHSAQEVALGLASSSGLASLGALTPIVLLAFTMQLSLMTRRGAPIDRALVIATFAILVGISIVNNQKALTFMIIVTFILHALADRIRIDPRLVVLGALGAALAFFYVAPLIHIVRGMELAKSDRVGATLKILAEAHYNPFELQSIEKKLTSSQGEDTTETLFGYLAPNDYGTERFTLLMPIDQMARASMRAPLGFGAFVAKLSEETLPKAIVGDHLLENLADQVAWRYSIRSANVIGRPALGVFGTGYGVAGGWGLLLLAPFATLCIFTAMKLVCNGSIWQNPWAIFIAASQFFDGEMDITIIGILFRSFIPLIVIAASVIFVDQLLNKSQAELTNGQHRPRDRK